MALIECPECGGVVSDKALSCPHCGFPISTPTAPSADTVTLKDSSTSTGQDSKSDEGSNRVKEKFPLRYGDLFFKEKEKSAIFLFAIYGVHKFQVSEDNEDTVSEILNNFFASLSLNPVEISESEATQILRSRVFGNEKAIIRCVSDELRWINDAVKLRLYAFYKQLNDYGSNPEGQRLIDELFSDNNIWLSEDIITEAKNNPLDFCIKDNKKDEYNVNPITDFSAKNRYAIMELLAFLLLSDEQTAYDKTVDYIFKTTMSELGLKEDDVDQYMKLHLKEKKKQEIKRLTEILSSIPRNKYIDQLYCKAKKIAEISSSFETEESVNEIFISLGYTPSQMKEIWENS